MSFVSGPFMMGEERSLTPVSSSPSIASSNSSSKENRAVSTLPPARGRSFGPSRRGRAGAVSPSSVGQPRRLSAAIVTAEESTHEYVKGRETIVVPSIETTLSHAESVHVRTTPKPQSIRRYCSAPLEQSARKVLTVPPPLRLEAWTEPLAESFKVRGPSYLRSSKKMPSNGSVFHLFSVDMVQSDKPIMTGLCSLPNERIQLALKREQETGIRELPPYVFAVNLALPGPPCFHLVAYFGVDDIEQLKTNKTPFGRVARRFFFGKSDKFRDETFKLIPRIVEGNFVVKKAVGSKPSLLGTKLNQKYIRNERFFELIVDIASDPVAQRIVKLSVGYARSLVVDMAFVLEGKEETTLPEKLLGAVRMKYLDFKDTAWFRVI